MGHGEPEQFGVHVPAQPVHGVLHYARRDPSLGPAEEEGRKVDAEHGHQQHAQRGEVDALPRNRVHGGEHVRQLGLTGFPQRLDLVCLGNPRCQGRADDSVEDHVRRIAEDLRCGDGERHGDDAEDQHGGYTPCVR